MFWSAVYFFMIVVAWALLGTRLSDMRVSERHPLLVGAILGVAGLLGLSACIPLIAQSIPLEWNTVAFLSWEGMAILFASIVTYAFSSAMLRRAHSRRDSADRP